MLEKLILAIAITLSLHFFLASTAKTGNRASLQMYLGETSTETISLADRGF